MRLTLLLLLLLTASPANGQIEAILGEEVPIDTIGIPRPLGNCESVKMTEWIDSHLPPDFRIENHIVYFKPTQPGVQRGYVFIGWDPEPNEQHCDIVGKQFDIEAKGVIDTLVRIHPKQQTLYPAADFAARVYRDTFALALVNKIDTPTYFGGWRLRDLPDTAYRLTVKLNDESISAYQSTGFEARINLTCLLELKLGPYWDSWTMPLTLLTDVSGPYDSVFVNEIPVQFPAISKLSMIGFIGRSRFDTIAGAIRRDTFQLRLRPTVHDLSIRRLNTPGVGEPSLINDSTLVFTNGPTPSGNYHTSGLIRWRWVNFSNLPQSDSEYYNISSIIQQLKPTPESLDWTGPLDSMPVFSLKVWKPEGLTNPRLKKGDQLVADAEILEGQDTIEIRFRSKREGLGEYYDYYNIIFDMKGPDGIVRSDFAVALIRLNILPKAGIAMETNGRRISLWPNPASEIVNLESSTDSPTEVSITDSIGRQIHLADRIGKTRLDVSDWPNGIYFVRSGNAPQQRLIVQH